LEKNPELTPQVDGEITEGPEENPLVFSDSDSLNRKYEKLIARIQAKGDNEAGGVQLSV